MTLEQLKTECAGEWRSIAPEIRPSSQKTSDNSHSIKPFYLARHFTYDPADRFELVITSFADPYGKIALSRMDIRGHIEWQGPHGIAPGAQKVLFTADEGFTVTPLVAGFADVLNQVTSGFQKWEVGGEQSILGRGFAPFGLGEGQLFKEYDLVYVYAGMMFWGARNVDGRGFDTEENRPTNLQVPMVRG